MKDLRHENVNTFIGFFHDCGVFAIMSEFCSRGTLEDLLLNDDAPLDWMFKSSLIMDLIKVVTCPDNTARGENGCSESSGDPTMTGALGNTPSRVLPRAIA